MSSYTCFIVFFLFSFLASFTVCAQNHTYIYHMCYERTTYSRNSTYFTNLRTLLSSLSSLNASYSTGFQNATSGQAPDRVTGLFLCRGDLSPEVCRSCVAFSVKDIFNRCPNEREVVLYYDECMLRYSDGNILSTTLSGGGEKTLRNNTNVTSSQFERFNDVVMSTLNQAVNDALANPRKFAVRKASVTVSQTVYGLVQCTPDLTRGDCLTCLQKAINELQTDSIGGSLLMPSCNSRFEIYPFYNETTITAPPPPGKSRNSKVLVVSIVVAITVALLLSIAGYCFLAKRTKKAYDTAPAFDGDEIASVDSLQLDYRIIQAATNNFSESNKIGRGGFGEVYMGTFSNGTEVAVKRLSKTSAQGDAEFKNEVLVVAKLKHKNLVRLLGFCLEREERILVYEFLPNKSLDCFLFDHAKKGELDWTKRYKIIEGTARGIMYLHQDSQLTIVHRDLKASNILLDEDINPKIADFGMARIFGLDQTVENTSRIVGTYLVVGFSGYMAPEYAMQGQYSTKSDVYSFGVSVLEIISGKKNSSFYQADGAHDLLSYAWRLWKNGKPLELMDPVLVSNFQMTEMVRCIHIGLLCVQEDPVDRPTIPNIVLMLTSNIVTLPVPGEPGLFFQSRSTNDPLDSDQSMKSKSVPWSVADVSFTDLYPR
ncbi:hypothetical protein HID58_056971 [Brassica napus]|uniref:Cysteine-rich receptor-like protein kinase 10 n=1 Tax=Brassica napus TaxID=3708 RepID=A0ABQ8APS2_BRANA|nr:hypothetical protein HID58_056971 [Brassica napus]